jgi:mono/diheme cytochrome c family protein
MLTRGKLAGVLATLAGVLAAGVRSDATVQDTQVVAEAKYRSPEWFEETIRPLLVERCFECHTNDASGGLRLDTREALLIGGESGSAIEPGNPDESLLIKVVQHVAKYPRMPKRASKLPPQEISALVEWVRAGAPWPESKETGPAPVAASRLTITPEHQAF